MNCAGRIKHLNDRVENRVDARQTPNDLRRAGEGVGLQTVLLEVRRHSGTQNIVGVHGRFGKGANINQNLRHGNQTLLDAQHVHKVLLLLRVEIVRLALNVEKLVNVHFGARNDKAEEPRRNRLFRAVNALVGAANQHCVKQRLNLLIDASLATVGLIDKAQHLVGCFLIRHHTLPALRSTRRVVLCRASVHKNLLQLVLEQDGVRKVVVRVEGAVGRLEHVQDGARHARLNGCRHGHKGFSRLGDASINGRIVHLSGKVKPVKNCRATANENSANTSSPSGWSCCTRPWTRNAPFAIVWQGPQ